MEVPKKQETHMWPIEPLPLYWLHYFNSSEDSSDDILKCVPHLVLVWRKWPYKQVVFGNRYIESVTYRVNLSVYLQRAALENLWSIILTLYTFFAKIIFFLLNRCYSVGNYFEFCYASIKNIYFSHPRCNLVKWC